MKYILINNTAFIHWLRQSVPHRCRIVVSSVAPSLDCSALPLFRQSRTQIYLRQDVFQALPPFICNKRMPTAHNKDIPINTNITNKVPAASCTLFVFPLPGSRLKFDAEQTQKTPCLQAERYFLTKLIRPPSHTNGPVPQTS